MKTSVDIPESVLEEAIKYSGARTKREAIVTAMEDFVRRRRMAELVKHAGTCTQMQSIEELEKLRRS